jgi:hypothetical protein
VTPEAKIQSQIVDWECVLAGDFQRITDGCAEAGMASVLHRSFDETAMELDILLGLPSS